MLVDQLKESEQTLREGLKRMDEVFGENKIKHQIYGTLLHNLGVVCEYTSRYEEAASFYKQAIDAYKAATDYGGDEEERKGDIELSENNLRIVQQKIKWLVTQQCMDADVLLKSMFFKIVTIFGENIVFLWKYCC